MKSARTPKFEFGAEMKRVFFIISTQLMHILYIFMRVWYEPKILVPSKSPKCGVFGAKGTYNII